MIYIKRFCFAIVSFICIFIGVVGTFIEILLYPIWGLTCYVITGYTHLDPCELSYIWKYSIKFLDWYENKFGPK